MSAYDIKSFLPRILQHFPQIDINEFEVYFEKYVIDQFRIYGYWPQMKGEIEIYPNIAGSTVNAKITIHEYSEYKVTYELMGIDVRKAAQIFAKEKIQKVDLD